MPWRSLRRTPGFTVAAILLLGIGIGGAAVVFSVADVLLLRPLAVPRPGELARVVELIPGRPPVLYMDWDDMEEFRAHTRSFISVIGQAELELTLGEDRSARVVRGVFVSENYFDVLGVRPALGHLPARSDEVLLGNAFWRGEYSSAPTVLGRTLRLNGQTFTIAGVLPHDFNGFSLESGAQVHLPFAAMPLLVKDARHAGYWEPAGRLRPGLTPAAAAAETAESMRAALIASAERTKPLTDDQKQAYQRQRFNVESIEHGVSRLRDRFGSSLLSLFAGAMLLLLLACANIAGMMVARAASREREMALRAALGATPWALIRLWPAESGVLAMAGGALAVVLVGIALPAIGRMMPPLRDLGANLVPVALDIRMNPRVLGFAVLLCGAAALLAGIAPALHAARASLVESIKATASDPRRARLRSTLTIIQVAICTVVLANSALVVATLRALRTAPAGFDRDHVITFTVDTPNSGDLPLRLEREARSLPGVDSTAIAARSLMRGTGFKVSVGLPGTRNGRDLNASSNAVSPEYFATMGIRLIEGRNLRSGDAAKDRKPQPVVVNQAFVRRFFPEGNPIGRVYGVGFDRVLTADNEIVGVVNDTRYRSLREPFQPISYGCMCDTAALNARAFQLEVRTRARPESVIAGLRTLLAKQAPGVAFREIRTMAQDVDDSLWAERTLAAIGIAFAGVAAVVAALGLYGLLSFTLSQRRRELGIRLALGAGRGEIARAVMVRVLMLVAVGAAVGTAVALWTGRMLSSVLFDVRPADPVIHAMVWMVVGATSVLACAVPVWRAARTDPAQALREN